MDGSKKEWKTIDEYIEAFPKDVQGILQRIRKTIRKAAPRSRRDDQLSNADIQTERQGVGLLRGVREAHWILSDSFRHEGLRKRTLAVQTRKRVGAISDR